MRMDRIEPGPLCGCTDDIVHRLPGQRLPAFGDEQPGQGIVARGQPAAQGAQLVPRDRMPVSVFWPLTQGVCEFASPPDNNGSFS